MKGAKSGLFRATDPEIFIKKKNISCPLGGLTISSRSYKEILREATRRVDPNALLTRAEAWERLHALFK